MPAKDRYHDTVVRALRKDGWTITVEQDSIRLGKRRLWIDIRAEKVSESLAILVEVKGFENMASPVEYLANAAGQYSMYKGVLEFLRSTVPLYLAAPISAYNNGILSELLGKQTLRQVGMRLIVFDPESEEIVQWIP